MKFLVLFALLGLAFAETYDEFKALNKGKDVSTYAIELGFATFDHEFNKFKIENNKQYDSADEEEKRKFNFLNTLKFIQKHNELYKKGEVTHEVGITLFADMTHDEYLKTFTMPSPLTINVTKQNYVYQPINHNLPASFDWRSQGKVTGVKNQGQCGSCWSFAAIATMESQIAIRQNRLQVLSEQQLIDCMNSRCQGNYINAALDYIRQNGVETSADYPHIATYGACHNVASKFHAHITGYHSDCQAAGRGACSDETLMNTIMNQGPIAIMFDAYGDDFMNYRGGILTTGQTLWRATHAVTMVGWGPNYWIVKNSWGTGWGENGYVRFAKGKNLRGINDYLYVATV